MDLQGPLQPLELAVMEAVSEGVIVLKAVRSDSGEILDFTCIEANGVAAELMGRPAADLAGLRLSVDAPRSVVAAYLEAMRRVCTTGENHGEDQVEIGGHDPLRGPRWFSLRIIRVLPDIIAVTLQETTTLVEQAKQLQLSERRYRTLAESMNDVIWVLDVESLRFAYISPSVVGLLGYTAEELMSQQIDAVLLPQDVIRVRTLIAHRVAELSAGTRAFGQTWVHELEQPRKGGSRVWTEVVGHFFRDEESGNISFRGVSRDVSLRRANAHALAQSDRRFRLAMHAAPIGMALVDLDRRFVEVNPALAHMLKVDVGWFLDRGVSDLVHPADDEADLHMRATVLGGTSDSVVRRKRLIAPDGTVVLVDHSVGLLRDEDGSPLSYISQFVDVTEIDRAQQMLEFIAAHDVLTGAANRRELSDRLAPLLERRSVRGDALALLFLDIDHFKLINDANGHLVGDAVLKAVARRIRTTLRSGDLFARVGGDEFVVALLGIATSSDVEAAVAKLRQRVVQPLTIDGMQFRVTISVGAAIAESNETMDTLLSRADAAVYRAKQKGRDRLSW